MTFRSSLQSIGRLPIAVACVASLMAASLALAEQDLDGQVLAALRSAGFTGTIQSQFLPSGSGDPLTRNLPISAGSCGSTSRAASTTTILAVGVTRRAGHSATRNRSRSASRTTMSSGPIARAPAISVARHSRPTRRSIPTMMWNGRFAAISGNPFDNSLGFQFPFPEGTTRFPPNDPIVTHLSIAQAHMPPTELVEVAGFTCTAGTIGPAIRSVRRRQRSVPPSGRRNRNAQ